MIFITHNTKCHGSVLSVSSGKKNLFVLDSTYHLSILSGKSLVPLKTYKLESKLKPLHQYNRSMSVGSSKELLYAQGGTHKVMHLTLGDGVRKYEMKEWHEGEVENICFDNSAKHYMTGGTDGRVHLFDTKSNGWLCSFEPRPDYISYSTFSPDDRYLLFAAFDRSLEVYDVERTLKLAEFESSEVIEAAQFYDNGNKICAISRDRSLSIFNIEEKSTEHFEDLFDSWPTVIELDESGRFALIGTKTNMLYLFSLEDKEILKEIKLDYQGCTLIKLTPDTLILGFIDGNVVRISRNNLIDSFESAFEIKDYKEAKKILEQNILLYFSDIARNFEKMWPEVLTKATKFIEEKKLDDAQILVEPFTKTFKRFRDEFDSISSKNREIDTFLQYIKIKKFDEAYAMIMLHPEIEHLEVYQRLEQQWKLYFRKAQKIMSSGLYDDMKKAEELLSPFAKVSSKKNLIQNLLLNAGVFETAQDLVKEKKFRNYFNLVLKYPFLKEAELYQKTLIFAESIHEKSAIHEQNHEFEQATKLLNVLKVFAPFTKQAENSLEKMKIYREFISHVNEENYLGAYVSAENHTFLQLTEEFNTLKDAFIKTYDKASDNADSGKPKNVLDDLDFYTEVDYWNNKVRNVMQVSYINEMKNSKDNTLMDWSTTFFEYTKLFGKDTLLKQVANYLDVNSLLKNIQDTEVPVSIPSSMYKESILHYKQ